MDWQSEAAALEEAAAARVREVSASLDALLSLAHLWHALQASASAAAPYGCACVVAPEWLQACNHAHASLCNVPHGYR